MTTSDAGKGREVRPDIYYYTNRVRLRLQVLTIMSPLKDTLMSRPTIIQVGRMAAIIGINMQIRKPYGRDISVVSVPC
jgi:hypothetical protein